MGCAGKGGGQIARWTTPTIRYKPQAVEMSEVEEIYAAVKQKGETVLMKSLEDAYVSEDGYFWALSQEETGELIQNLIATVQVDYKTKSGQRYTTFTESFYVSGSARNEVF